MKRTMALPSVIFVLLLFGCTREAGILSTSHNRIIALQPIDHYVINDLESFQRELGNFYHTQVIVLKPIPIPESFFNRAVQKYSADSMVSLLSKIAGENNEEVIGITYFELYTIKDGKKGMQPYFDEDIFGLGYLPGNACVVSDIKLRTINSAVFNNRLRNVIIHEVGHNMGLQHCSDTACIMSEANGGFPALDKKGMDYCNKCKRELLKLHAVFIK